MTSTKFAKNVLQIALLVTEAYKVTSTAYKVISTAYKVISTACNIRCCTHVFTLMYVNDVHRLKNATACKVRYRSMYVTVSYLFYTCLKNVTRMYTRNKITRVLHTLM